MPRMVKVGNQVFNLDQVACIQYDEVNERAIFTSPCTTDMDYFSGR